MMLDELKRKRRKIAIICVLLFILFTSLTILGWVQSRIIGPAGGLSWAILMAVSGFLSFLTAVEFFTILYHYAGICFFIAFVGLVILIIGIISESVLAFIIGGIILAVSTYFLVESIKLYRMALYNPNKLEKQIEKYKEESQKQKEQKVQELEVERMMAEESQKDPSPWSVKYYTFPCQYCGHYKVRPATWDDKKFSVAFWGIMSPKLGKNYKCERCGSVW